MPSMVKMPVEGVKSVPKRYKSRGNSPVPTAAQRRYLERGLDQPGGKLPIFDEEGQEISLRTIESCIANGWAERWFANPIKPDWLVCRLTGRGFKALSGRSGRN